MALERVKATLETVLGVFVTRLGTISDKIAAPVVQTLDEKLPKSPPPAASFMAVTLGEQQWWTGEEGDPGNASDLMMDARVTVVFWVRRSLDMPGRATNLLAQVTGVVQAYARIIGALWKFEPTDSNGDYVLTEPVHFDGGTRPTPEALAQAEDWAAFTSHWSARFEWLLPS